MIANLTAGSKIKFQYIGRDLDINQYPYQVNYLTEDYTGKVLEVRDTLEKRVDNKTIFKKPGVERSRFLITVQLPDNKIKSFYDGRVINLEEVKEVPKGFLKRTLDKLRGK